jgi:acyl-CoA synthetase (AMP-forming)/AMP-acid ligase II
MTMAHIIQMLERNARRTPEREALVYGERRLNYRQLDAEVNRTAWALQRRGLSKGERIGLISFNSDQFVLAYYAILKLGAIVVPINPRSAPPELAYQLTDCGASALLFDPALEGTIQDARAAVGDVVRLYLATSPLPGWDDLSSLAQSESGEALDIVGHEDDDAEIIYTSGTTGQPKGVVLDHHRVIWCGLNISMLVGIREGDRIVHVAPLYHSAELNLFLMAGTMFSCTHVVLPAFDPGIVLDTLEQERITLFFGVPTMYQFLLRQPNLARRDLSALRVGMYGAAPMSPTVVRELVAALPHVALYNLCGLTEAGPGGIALGPQDQLRKPGAGGKAISNTEARVVDEQMRDVAPGEVGEFVLRGESVMKGYWNKPEATAATFRGDWLLTGDLATIDEEGYISLVDRKKDMIITGGMNVYCVEVENAVQAHPAILDCAVVGAAHQDYGETVVAVVTLKPGATLKLEELRDHCRPLIADYKIPRRLVIDVVPRNASGKILKYQLRARLKQEAGA